MFNRMHINSVNYHRAVRCIVLRRCMTTCPKDPATVSKSTVPAVKDICPPIERLTGPKNWINYGFENKDYEGDRQATHSVFFFSVTICLVLGGYYLLYLPDYNLRDWARREGYLELRRRELAGLPLVDPNLIDPSKIVLPTDEELGDTEIIL